MTLALAFVNQLAQAAVTTTPGYRPFVTPLPVWNYWIWLLIPLCLGVSIVYKAIRIERIADIPKQALIITGWIIGGMAAAAVALAIIVRFL
jgi:hypothetical protein